MLITIDELLLPAEVREFRELLDAADWQNGVVTAGSAARLQKHNQQVDERSAMGNQLGQRILRKLGVHPLFISAALPCRIHPPRFNRYADGGQYGTHVDGALMSVAGSQSMLRTDLSATLFLSDPGEYDGGELQIETAFGVQAVKLEAGSLVLYPSGSLHQVTPVTRGARIASFFWIESMVRDESARTMLFDLDRAIQALTPRLGAGDAQLRSLTAIYHNLLRRWAVT